MSEPTMTLPRLSEIMTRDVATFRPEQEILHAMEILIARHLSGAPVVDGAGALVGVLSKKDCLVAALNASYYSQWGGQIAQYMTSDVETLPPEMDVLAAAQHFLGSNYRRFPVTENGRLIGIVSRIDLLRTLARLWR